MDITIGIPTYNRSKLLSKQLNSLKNQEFQNFKILISDNCSTDETEKICNIYQKSFKSFKYIKQKKNIHVIDNYYYLFKNSDTKYFMWLADDDYIDNDYLKICYDFISKNSEYVLVSGVAKYYKSGELIFTGKEINIENDDVNKRICAHYSLARDNGNFYGIYDKEKILDYIYPRKYGGDLMFLANILLFGKFKSLNNTTIHRDLGGGTSALLEGVIKSLDLSRWHLYFFHFITAFDIYQNSLKVQKLFKDKIKFNFFFEISTSYSYLKKNFLESILHIFKIILFKNKKKL